MFEDLTPLPDPPAAPESLSDWKAGLREDLDRWLQSVEEIPLPDELEETEAATPDLYSFFEQLAVLGTESRRANRRTAETLSQWGEALSRFDDELGRIRELVTQSLAARGIEVELPRAHCVLLIELLDRVRRVGRAFESTPPRPWWGGDSAWRKAWETQRQAFGIVTDHLEALLRKSGVVRLLVTGTPFDPTCMVAVATEPSGQHPPQTVLEEILAGYLRQDELLRPAQVKLSTSPSRS